MNTALQSLLPAISGIVIFSIGFFILLKSMRSPLNQLFFLECGTLTLWLFAYSGMYGAAQPREALAWARVGFVGIVFIPIFIYHFYIEFFKFSKGKVFAVIYLMGLFFTVFSQTDLIYSGMRIFSWGWYPSAGLIYPAYVLFFASTFSYSLYILIHMLITTPKNSFRYNQTKYLLISFVVATVGIVDYPPKFGIPIYPFGYIPALLWILIVAYTIVRFQLLDVKVVLTRAGILAILYTLILGLPFWYAARTQQWYMALVLMAGLASSGPFIFHFLRNKADAILLAQQRRYQHVLLQASEGMAREHDLNRLLKMIVYIIKRSVRTTFVAVILDDKETESYDLRALRSSEKDTPWTSFSYTHPLIEFLKKKKEPCLWEELPEELRAEVVPEMHVSLIVPSFIEKRLVGFLFLGNKLNNTLYSRDDINVFITLSNQAALAIENCMFMEKFKTTQERLFNAEKLALIGGMADGLAHQIKNRLNQFALAGGEMGLEIDEIQDGLDKFVRNPAELKDKLAYLKKCTDSITDNVKKTNSVIQGVLQFAKTENKGSCFSSFDLGALVTQCAELLKIKHQIADLPLEVNLGDDAFVYGVQAQILECLLNTLDNAYEAIEEKMNYHLKDEERRLFKPMLRLSLSHNHKTSLITISDNGIGIKDDSKLKVFSAFFTTKPSSKSGSGIGTYVVRRMILENHKGKIWFESIYGTGSTFYIELPRYASKLSDVGE